MADSPNPLNYFEGKGILSFTPTGGAKRDLGNAPSVQLSPAIEERQHFSSRTSIRTEDKRDTVQRSLNFSITLDEITIENLALFFAGTVANDSDGNQYIDVFGVTQVTGAFELVGTNDIGNKFRLDIPSASVIPQGEFDFIGEDYGELVLSGLAQAVDGIPATITEISEATA